MRQRQGLTFPEGLAILAMLAWLSIGVGPWWLGIVLFVGTAIGNLWWLNR